MIKTEELEKVFRTACETVVEGMTSTDEESLKHRHNHIKEAMGILKFAGFEVDFEHSEECRQVAAETLHFVDAEPPVFDDLEEECG